jgi:hypothetical protein
MHSHEGPPHRSTMPRQKRNSSDKTSAFAAVPAQQYERTPREQRICEGVLRDCRDSPPPVSIKVTTGRGKREVTLDHPDPPTAGMLLMRALGTTCGALVDQILLQTLKTFNLDKSDDETASRKVTSALAMIQGIGPQDATEAMLAAQMVSVHNAMMDAAGRMGRVEMLDQFIAFSNAMNKLGRTYACQVDALKRYRSTGEQSIKVQHVTVNDGGQAIVGNVASPGGGASTQKGGLPHGLGALEASSPAYASGTPMQSKGEALAPALPSAGSEGLERMPVPRGTRRSAEG